MKVLTLIVLILLSSCGADDSMVIKKSDSPIVPDAQLNTITANELKFHLSFLASDEMRGRDATSNEIKIAAKYLANHLESWGFRGAGENGSFFQKVPLYSASFKKESGYLAYNGKKLTAEYGKDYAIYSFGSSSVKRKMKAISLIETATNDFANFSHNGLKDKIAIRHSKDNSDNQHRAIRNKLFENGTGVVVWVIGDEKVAEEMAETYAKFALGSQMGLKLSDSENVYIVIKESSFKKLIGSEKYDSGKESIFKQDFEINFESDITETSCQNVVAILDGSDPVLKNEFVGYGSHYDHDGVKNGQIYNGADDDGSGTVGVLAIAKAMSKNPPKRSIFINFHTAEEKGLLGSAYFAENPLIPLEKLVAMVNMDMIGSYYKPERVHVVGADKISKELHVINEEMNKITHKMVLDYTYNADDHPERIYYRSDHYNYAKKGVPIIFYTNDNPDHYHKPSDDVETINFDKLCKIAQLAMRTGYHVANQAKRLTLNEKN
jgi:hypothetical protein